jgi:hypothetical protein
MRYEYVGYTEDDNWPRVFGVIHIRECTSHEVPGDNNNNKTKYSYYIKFWGGMNKKKQFEIFKEMHWNMNHLNQKRFDAYERKDSEWLNANCPGLEKHIQKHIEWEVLKGKL